MALLEDVDAAVRRKLSLICTTCLSLDVEDTLLCEGCRYGLEKASFCRVTARAKSTIPRRAECHRPFDENKASHRYEEKRNTYLRIFEFVRDKMIREYSSPTSVLESLEEDDGRADTRADTIHDQQKEPIEAFVSSIVQNNTAVSSPVAVRGGNMSEVIDFGSMVDETDTDYVLGTHRERYGQFEVAGIPNGAGVYRHGYVSRLEADAIAFRAIKNNGERRGPSECAAPTQIGIDGSSPNVGERLESRRRQEYHSRQGEYQEQGRCGRRIADIRAV